MKELREGGARSQRQVKKGRYWRKAIGHGIKGENSTNVYHRTPNPSQPTSTSTTHSLTPTLTMKLTHLSPLAVWAIITNLTTAAPTTTTTTTTSSNPNDPSKFTPEQAISTFHNSRHKSSSISKREVRCDIIPGDFRMWTSHGRVVPP